MLTLATLGCNAGSEDEAAVGTTASAGQDGTDGAETGETGTDSAVSEATGDTGDEGTFIAEPDGGSSSIECDVWAQDCAAGEKCMPWANDGGTSWNATKCAPLDQAPGQPGDTCTVEGSDVAGLDDCDVASMCWHVDPQTNMGTCVSFCAGSEANPTCQDPATDCAISNDGVLILCLPTCNPLVQDCADGQGCYPVNDSFLCYPDYSYDLGAYSDPCEFLNVCDPGLFCAVPAGVPGCQGGSGCCSEYCDLDDPDAASGCSGVAGGQDCVAWYQAGQEPPGLESVGACLIP